jgi:N-acetylmuramoyl-L-alanine amidase
MTLREEFIPINTPPRPGLPLHAPMAITIHWIGPYPNQSPYDVIKWWKTGPDGKGIQASAHYVIKNDLIINCIPTDEVAWHCGSKGNYTSIGIEVVPASRNGEFSTESIASLKELIEKWPDLELLRHYDWTQKDCPRYYTPITGLMGVEGRVDNPTGGQARWEELKKGLRNE